MEKGFDNALYVKIQSEKIRERFGLFDKLYLEIGGKLFEDTHAARVLPGFKSNAKISMFQELKKDLEIIYCINANDIERNKTRADYGITYDKEIERLINQAKDNGFSVNSVVITLYKNQPSVDTFIKKLNRQNIKTYIHTFTKGYPTDVNTIVSDEGYGANPYIKTTKKLILVNAPGPGSGKLATCLSQLYHEHKQGINAGYAKFETFPVWDLPLRHPVNLAYEAATADLKDVNMIDPFHLEKYGVTAVNYNRDVETFPILKAILHKITGKDIYFSPTDMGVNTLAKAITDDKIVQEASKREIVRRYFNERCNYKIGKSDYDSIQRIKLLMNELKIDEDFLDVIKPALKKAKKTHKHVVSLKLPNGKIITGKQTDLLEPTCAVLLNAVKELNNIPDNIDLLAKNTLAPIIKLRKNTLTEISPRLNLQELLIALSIGSVTNPMIKKALNSLKDLDNCEAHSTYIISNGDLKTLKSLHINLTCEPNFLNDKIF